MKRLPWFARALLAGSFVRGGWRTFNAPEKVAPQVASLGFADPETITRVNGIAQMAGAGAMVLGIFPRLAAAGLAASLVPTTFAAHRFWEIEDEQARNAQVTQFLKNAGIVGGLLLVAAWPKGGTGSG